MRSLDMIYEIYDCFYYLFILVGKVSGRAVREVDISHITILFNFVEYPLRAQQPGATACRIHLGRPIISRISFKNHNPFPNIF